MFGSSPDGLGLDAMWSPQSIPQMPITEYEPTPGGVPPQLPGGAAMPVPYPIHQLPPLPPGVSGYQSNLVEPRDTSPQAAVQSAGISALLLAVGVAAGAAAGGGWGAAGGLCIAAAAMNGYRAQKWMDSKQPGERHEAVVSATFAVFQVGGAGYFIYRAMKR